MSSGNNDGDDIFSMSEEEDLEEDSADSISSPTEHDDDPTSQGNDPNVDEEDDENEGDGDRDGDRDGDDGDGGDDGEGNSAWILKIFEV